MRKNSDRHKKAHKAQITFLCILCLFAAPKAFTQQVDMVQLFEQIATLIRDDRLPEAEKELNAVLRVTPDLPVALNLMGTIRAKQNRLLEAETLFLRAVQADKNFTGARMNLVHLYLLKRTPAKAIVQLKEIVAIEPDNAEAAMQLAELLIFQGSVDECISFIEKQRAGRAVSPNLLVALGNAYIAKNDLAKAEENYLVALEGRLENAGALFGLAQISRMKGENREAAIYLNRVATLTADSKSPEFLYKFAVEAMRVGMFDEAKSALERSLELKPKEPTYLLALGITWIRKGNLFDAEKVFRRLIEIEPNNAQAQLHLGYVLLNQKKYDEARVWLEKSARPGVAIPEVYYYLGLVAQEQNDDAR